jgi:hypothetical protein
MSIAQITVNGCCDFLAQCILVRILNHCTYHPFYSPRFSKIYRCWIVWGQIISVVIVPSFLAITYLGQSIDTRLLSRLQFIAGSLATWLAGAGSLTIEQGEVVVTPWGGSATTTGFILSIVVNTLVTGLIVFKIRKMFLEYKAASVTTSVERTLGTTGGTILQVQHVIFIIIESGMALLAVQLARFVLYILPSASSAAYYLIIASGISEMINVIISSVRFYFFCFTDKIYLLDRASHQQ